MVPHIYVHRRSHQNRRRRGKIHRGQKVVGNSMRELGQNIRRRRCHHQRLGPLRLADVLNPVLLAGRFTRAAGPIVPETGNHTVPGKRRERQRLHKPARRFRHHHVDFKGLSLQCAHQLRGFVRGNPARHAYRYSHGSIVDQMSICSRQ